MSAEQTRPYIVVHMLSSVDGRLLCGRYSIPYGENDLNFSYDSYTQISDNYNPEAILMGRNSVTYYVPKLWDPSKYKPAAKHETYKGIRETKQLQVIVDRKGLTYYETNTIRNLNIIAVLGESVSEEYMAHLRSLGISYCFAGKDGNDLKTAVETLYREFGIKTLVDRGGGIINGEFLKQGLIDEISLMICPSIDGLSGIPSIFEYLGKEGELPHKGQSLEFIEAKNIGHGTIYLRYKVHHNQ